MRRGRTPCLAAGITLLLGCAAHRIPTELRGYTILVERGGADRDALARAFQEGGFRVRRAVRGGSGPTAALVAFTFRPAETDGSTWLHVRLADTRSGLILRAGSLVLDSTGRTPRGRAQAALRAILAQDTVFLAP